MTITGIETETPSHGADAPVVHPADKPGSGYFVLVLLMAAAIGLFLLFAIPTFSGIVSLMLQDAAGG
jgi:hypothetical protein